MDVQPKVQRRKSEVDITEAQVLKASGGQGANNLSKLYRYLDQVPKVQLEDQQSKFRFLTGWNVVGRFNKNSTWKSSMWFSSPPAEKNRRRIEGNMFNKVKSLTNEV
ncbi:hypothetical protein CEXT_90091 [Caerostris extrusa]|uniref:Uncharacterized protein n=1 Tax=Caerostris extrusa TaxID=172846 RepID=A0AAV4WSA3_CAEEX|nr:hypothetical protein CEXT_90091 [Caerostris extrusa]